jgi:hypothetical protein
MSQHLRFQQPNFNFNLGSRAGGSITPFQSLLKTPNPIQRLLHTDEKNKLSEVKGDLMMKANLAAAT